MTPKQIAYRVYLKSPHWAALRLEVLNRDGYKCCRCSRTKLTLHVHHKLYREKFEDSITDDLITLCEICHKEEHGIIKLKHKVIKPRRHKKKKKKWNGLTKKQMKIRA